MKQFIPFVVGSLLLIAGGAPPAQAETPPPPPNAIVSEGNGAAVFIGYGADRQVQMSWRPSKKYEGASMLYQVQRGDGAMLESRTSASSFTDRNLLPNTTYAYSLISFQSLKKTVVITKGPNKGQSITRTITKRVGTNTITVLTLPSMVVGLSATPNEDGIAFNWQPPQYATNPFTYSVVMGGNLMAYGMTTLTYAVSGLGCGKKATITVVVENAAGQAPKNASLSASTTACPRSKLS
jgi:hypothetical protein